MAQATDITQAYADQFARLRATLPGAADPKLAALREGVGTIALNASEPIWSRVAQIAVQCDASVLRIDRAGALDLADSNNPQRDCYLYLSNTPDGVAKPGVLG